MTQTTGNWPPSASLQRIPPSPKLGGKHETRDRRHAHQPLGAVPRLRRAASRRLAHLRCAVPGNRDQALPPLSQRHGTAAQRNRTGARMSGGSFNYLYAKYWPDIANECDGELRNMADELAALGYAEDAAAETEELILIMRQAAVRVRTRQDRLKAVWKAVEWWKSSDSGEEAI